MTKLIPIPPSISSVLATADAWVRESMALRTKGRTPILRECPACEGAGVTHTASCAFGCCNCGGYGDSIHDGELLTHGSGEIHAYCDECDELCFADVGSVIEPGHCRAYYACSEECAEAIVKAFERGERS